MFRVDIRRLDRERSLPVHLEIAASDPLWEDVDPGFGGPVRVDLTLTSAPSGQIFARGRWRAPLLTSCRRCLAVVEWMLDQEVEFVWSVPDQLDGEWDSDDDEVRYLDPKATEVDVGAAIREDLLLAFPRYVLCDEACKGMCPRCGTNRNEGDCDCTLDEPDPRWDALRGLKKE